jgi:hypothetical protein
VAGLWFDGSATNPLTVKYDSSLNVVSKKYFSTGSGYISTLSISGYGSDIYVADNFSTGSQSAFIMKLDENLGVLAAVSSDDGQQSQFMSIAIDSGGVYTTGIDQNSQGLIVKYDSNLDVVSSRSYQNLSGIVDLRSSIISGGNLYISGGTNFSGTTDGLLMRFVGLGSGSYSSTPVGFSLTDLSLINTDISVAASNATALNSAAAGLNNVSGTLVSATSNLISDAICIAK